MNIWKALPIAAGFLAAQAQTPLSIPTISQQGPTASAPSCQPTLVQGSAKTINYRDLKSSMEIDLKATALFPGASGVAKVKSEKGAIRVIAKVKDLPPATSLGGEFLTYVLWGISPEGRATNLGEMVVKNGKCKIEVTEGLQTFGLIVTAEPYFAVSQPSDSIVMENAIGKSTKGRVEILDAKFERVKRGHYAQNLAGAAPMVLDDKTPLEVYQARNAVRIARAAGAPAFAGEPFEKAEGFLKQAETGGSDQVMMAREAIQRAEDSRLLSIQHQETERVAQERKWAQEKLDDAKREASMAAAAQETALKMAKMTESENEALKSKLMEQLNAVLQTRATARGLIVNMSGVLFQTGKATLAPAAREKLSKIAGILSAHKGLKIEADGFTDSTGSEAFNRELSEKRAMMTRDFLVSQGVPSDSIIFKGFGEENPIAPNDTDSGRKENRRVELVVSGEGVTDPSAPAPK